MRASFTLLACLIVHSAAAATIRSLEVKRLNGRYEFVSDTFLDAPPAAIFTVLTDYNNNRFGRISSVYKESRYMPPAPDGTPLVYTRVEGCLLFFCKTMRRVERMETVAPTFIRTTALPEQSDFRYSRSEWKLEPEGDGTRVKYRLTMEPAFWVPPIVGPWFLKRNILRGGERAVNRIEALARELGEGRTAQHAGP
jgi:Polyketide cyclase / dehydrase and lipid transport